MPKATSAPKMSLWTRLEVREFARITGSENVQRFLQAHPSVNGKILLQYTVNDFGSDGIDFIACRDAVKGMTFQEWKAHKRGERFWEYIQKDGAPSRATAENAPFERVLEPLVVDLAKPVSREFRSRVGADLERWLSDNRARNPALYLEQAPEKAFGTLVDICLAFHAPKETKQRDIVMPFQEIPIELKVATNIKNEHISQLLCYMARQFLSRGDIKKKTVLKGAIMSQSHGEMQNAVIGMASFHTAFLEVAFQFEKLPEVKLQKVCFQVCFEGHVVLNQVARMGEYFFNFFGDSATVSLENEVPVEDEQSSAEEEVSSALYGV